MERRVNLSGRRSRRFLEELSLQDPFPHLRYLHSHGIADSQIRGAVEEHFLEVPGPAESSSVTCLSSDDDLFHPSDHHFRSPFHTFCEDSVEHVPPSCLFRMGYVILEMLRCIGSRPFRISCDIGEVEDDLFHRADGVFEFLSRLPGESDDEIGRYRKRSVFCPQILDLGFEILIAMLPIHSPQHVIIPALKGEMEIIACVLEVEVRIEDILRHIMRIRRSETDPVYSSDSIHLFKKLSEWGFEVMLGSPLREIGIPEPHSPLLPIAVDILPKQDDLLRSPGCNFRNLIQDLFFSS